MSEKDNEILDPVSQQELEVESDSASPEEASVLAQADSPVEDTDPEEEPQVESATTSDTIDDVPARQGETLAASEESVSTDEISDEEAQVEDLAAGDEISPEGDEAIERGAGPIEESQAEASAEEIEAIAEVESSPAEGETEDVVSIEEDVSVEQPSDGEDEEPDQELAAAPARAEEPDDGRLWYVVHCYSGYENKVRHNLEQRIETMGMKAKIFDVVVPTEEEIEIKNGKRRTVERRVFPGYILVQMIMDEDSWYVVRNTPGVTGFVGMGNEPTPLRPEEVSQIVKRMEAEAPRIKVTYKLGQKVRIIDGPFNDFIGTVSDIDMERAKVRVMVSFFGRETPVELDFLQVEKA